MNPLYSFNNWEGDHAVQQRTVNRIIAKLSDKISILEHEMSKTLELLENSFKTLDYPILHLHSKNMEIKNAEITILNGLKSDLLKMDIDP